MAHRPLGDTQAAGRLSGRGGGASVACACASCAVGARRRPGPAPSHPCPALAASRLCPGLAASRPCPGRTWITCSWLDHVLPMRGSCLARVWITCCPLDHVCVLGPPGGGPGVIRWSAGCPWERRLSNGGQVIRWEWAVRGNGARGRGPSRPRPRPSSRPRPARTVADGAAPAARRPLAFASTDAEGTRIREQD